MDENSRNQVHENSKYFSIRLILCNTLVEISLTSQEAVIIYSGGMDSFTLLNKILKEHSKIYALSFDYGQKHKKELVYAKNVCDDLCVHHKIIDVTTINCLLKGSSLTSDISVPSHRLQIREWRFKHYCTQQKYDFFITGCRLCYFN